MSFSRAPLKRFNEQVGCAPPPGIYEIKPGEPKGAASFDKCDRFKPPKAVAGSSVAPPPSPSRQSLVSPVRRTLSVDVLVEGSTVKKGKQSMTLEKKLQVQLENEIRTLVKQRGEQDRRLLTVEEELKKVEAKLLAGIREKTALSATIQTLERQQVELKKVNEFLKNKVSADTTKKRINSLTMDLMEARNNLDSKNKELNVLQVNTRGSLKVLESDLRTAKETNTSLKEKHKDLEDLHQVTKNINDELETENARLQGVVLELREEVRALQGYLDAANEEIQELRLKLKKSSAMESQQDRIKGLEIELEQRITELVQTEDLLSQKKSEALKYQQDLEASQQTLLKVEQQLEEKELTLKRSQNSVIDLEEQLRVAKRDVLDSQEALSKQEKEVVRFREVLRRTEQELDERVAHLEQRCMFSEEERTRTQEEGLRRVEQLKTELNLLTETNNAVLKRRFQLEQQVAALTEELAKEKALVDSLSVLLEQDRQDSEEKYQQLHDELEEVLGELSLMEDKDQRRMEVMKTSQEALERLQEQKEEVERELCDAKALLNKQHTAVTALTEEHASAMMDLQDAHLKSLSKIEVLLTELESTKEALSASVEKQKSLEVEAERVNRQIKEMDNVIVQREEAIKRVSDDLEEQQKRQMEEREAWEGKAEMVQIRLAEKEEELRDMEESHATLISQLQRELQLQTVEKEEALGQVEEIKGRLQNDKKMEDEIRELGQTVEELLQERQEKVTLEMALQDEREARAEERRAHEEVTSKMQQLHMDVERLNEEKKSLASQTQLAEQRRLDLQNQLDIAHQDSAQFQSRLADVEQAGAGFQSQLVLLEKRIQILQCELKEEQQDSRTLQQQVELLSQEKVTLQWEMEEQRREFQLTQAQEASSNSSETEHWRNMYEVLLAKVKPFQEQLDSFAAERNALLNENGANQDELNKLADAYARLLGHQNQKQKIKHVMKLKDENIGLKQELGKLRTQLKRQKCDLEQMKEKLPGAPRRRFDPSKAFQHDKENMETPLKEANHCA